MTPGLGRICFFVLGAIAVVSGKFWLDAAEVDGKMFKGNQRFASGQALPSAYIEEYSEYYSAPLLKRGDDHVALDFSEAIRAASKDTSWDLCFESRLDDCRITIDFQTSSDSGFVSGGTISFTDGQKTWDAVVTQVGAFGWVDADKRIPNSLRRKLKKMVASVTISDGQSQADLQLLEKLFQFKAVVGASEIATIDKTFEIQRVRDELVKSLTRQILKSDLFKPNPVLQRFLNKNNS